MKNKVKHGFLAYLLIFLCLIVGCAVVVLALMILSPGISIFGYKFINHNSDKAIRYVTFNNGLTSEERLIDDMYKNNLISNIEVVSENYTINEKEIKSGRYSIYLQREPSSSELKFMLNDHTHGFTNSEEYNNTEYQLTYDLLTRTLKLTIKDAYFKLATSSNIAVYIYIPTTDTYNSTNISFNLQTTTGNIVLGNTSNNCKVLGVSATTTKGNITLKDSFTSTLDIDLKSESGNLILSEQNTATLSTLRQISLQTNTGKIKTKKINGSLNITSEKSICEIDGDVTGNVTYSSPYGLIKTKNIGGSFKAEETVSVSEITLGEVNGDVTMISGEASNVTIEKTNAKVRVKTENGNIKIKNIAGNTIFNDYHELETKSGNITYTNNSSSSIKVTTTKGKISATYNILEKTQDITNTNGDTNIYIENGLSATINSTTQGNITYNWKNGETLTGSQTATIHSPNTNQVINITSEDGDIDITEIIA